MPTNAVLVQDCESLTTSTPLFCPSLAQSMGDLLSCQRLRYLVFNCELGGGLTDSEDCGLDRDRFDLICDHLMVHDAASGNLVGTYRMQTGYRAKGNLGYYSEQLFDLGPSRVFEVRHWSSEGLAFTQTTETQRHCSCYGKGLRRTRPFAMRAT
jgi:putative hemolysin